MKPLYIFQHAACLIFAMLLLSSSFCSESDLPPFSNATTGTWDISFSSVSLEYDLSYTYLDSLRNNVQSSAISDYYELNAYHPGIYMAKGAITSFGDILRENIDFSGCEETPSISFYFRALDFRRSQTFTKKEYDYDLCSRNTITNVPKIEGDHYIDFTIKTAKVSNGFQLIWMTPVFMQRLGVPAINATAKLNPKLGIPKSGVSNTSQNGNLYPRQDVAIGDPFEEGSGNTDHADLDDIVIENTVSENLPGGDYYVVPNDVPMAFSPVLLQNVYSGGIFHNNLRWNQPHRAILDPVDEDGRIGREPDNCLGVITLE